LFRYADADPHSKNPAATDVGVKTLGRCIQWRCI